MRIPSFNIFKGAFTQSGGERNSQNHCLPSTNVSSTSRLRMRGPYDPVWAVRVSGENGLVAGIHQPLVPIEIIERS